MHGRCTEDAQVGHGRCMEDGRKVYRVAFLRSGGDKKSGLYVNEVVISVIKVTGSEGGPLADQKSLRVH